MFAKRRWSALFDLAALVLLLSYAVLVWSAEGGNRSAALDPVLAAARERGTLRVAVDIGFRPFTDQDATGAIVGYDIDLTRAIAARLGLQVEFVPTGFDGLYDVLTSGRADLIASALPYAPEQGFRARFSAVYFDAGQLLVVPSDSAVATIGDLDGRTIGVALGSDADSLARRLAPGDGFILHSSYDEPAAAFADLQAGRLDAVITDGVAARSAVNSEPQLRIAQALSYEPLVLGMPRPAFQLEAEVNRALKELRSEGFFAELDARWLR